MSTKFDEIGLRLLKSRRAVAFSGAGISTESGIPDFRSPGGIWQTSQPVYFDEFVQSAPARHEYWRQKAIAHRDFAHAQPNIAHRSLARWEAQGALRGVITQNIDELHQAAGSANVLELHGTARKVGCLDCGVRFAADGLVEEFLRTETVPDCPQCGGLMKHATVSFGQSLPADVLEQAIDWSREADFFLVIGSSLVVTPAAELPALAKRRGATLAIINRDKTPLDSMADFVIRDEIGVAFGAIAQSMENNAPRQP